VIHDLIFFSRHELANIFKTFVYDVGFIILFMLWALVFFYKNQARARYGLILALGFLCFFSFSPTMNFLLKFLTTSEEQQLDARFLSRQSNHLITKPNCVGNAQAIVVLGGGSSSLGIPSLSTFSRVLGLVELLKNLPSSEFSKKERPQIILSGGVVDSKNKYLKSESSLMYQTLKLYYPNISDFRTIEESSSLNTKENAYYTRKIFEKNGIKKNIVLITNTMHMKRSKYSFEKEGFQVCSVSVVSTFEYGDTLFSFKNAKMTTQVLHEYIGNILYRFF
jgi:uncharacterized SAM-binding protein YcdF (DUF218 family)